MARSIVLLIIVFFFSFSGKSSHVLGGDITWTCVGGQYVFQLEFYRDCNGADINPVSENLSVWNHPTLTQIQVNFIARIDISPLCTQVPTGPSPFICGSGPNTGNGVGALEKIIYQSDPITISGTPPAPGWIFTFKSFSRSDEITNLQAPNTYGITLSSTIFNLPNAAVGCVDNSAQFLQDPYFVSCSGDPYEYNMNAVDPDLDSLHIFFGTPMNDFTGTYNPPVNPIPVPFISGFTTNTPTPGPGFNAGNIDAQIDPVNGNLTFLSNTVGFFNVKIVAQSYRNGILMSEVEREMQLIVQNCVGTNTAPVITGPFGGLFETTINAGTLVNFNLAATDIELLQDGTPQSNILTSTGLMYGTNYTSNAGCAIAPCATLNTTPPIAMVQGVNTTFNWQTDCNHLVNPDGDAADLIPYHFVFKVQDDYCPVPKVSYATITINVVNPGVIQMPAINCIQTNAADDVTISWNPAVDPNGTFVEYQIFSVQNGLLGTVNNLNTGSYTDPAVGQINDYYIGVISGCNGNTVRYSDTIRNIRLGVLNPLDGTAILVWNAPANSPLPSMGNYYHIYREYPLGIWTLYDSVPYGSNSYKDTIDICSAQINYQIVLPNQPCDYTSNIDGDVFQDMITPDIPIIEFVTIDTITNSVNISWNQNYQPDTYGYVIYAMNQAGVLVEIDTVWGITNTTYTLIPGVSLNGLSFSVAAFDSCWTASVPPTHQTSGKAEIHTTIFLNTALNICDHTVDLTWSDYIGWDAVEEYIVYGHKAGEAWSVFGSSSTTNLTVDVDEAIDYCFVVEAVHLDGRKSFSNIRCQYISIPKQPAFNYLQVATVNGSNVDVRYYVDASANISEIIVHRKEGNSSFEEIGRVGVASNNLSYTDSDVNVALHSYTYVVQIIDSCGFPGAYSNEAETMLLQLDNDPLLKLNYLYWTAYREFDGSILGYNIYRGIDGPATGTPIATVPFGQTYYEDNVLDIATQGEICYRVEAVESINSYGFSEQSFSNERCITLPPVIYVPNAFWPEGINSIFKPIVSDFDLASYEFIIFNRWGQAIFKTNSVEEGWNGIIDGTSEMAATGTYLYMVILRDGSGVEVVTRGHVTLLK